MSKSVADVYELHGADHADAVEHDDSQGLAVAGAQLLAAGVLGVDVSVERR
ncbi:hypothetical protein ACFYRN_38825 [Streptomyces sp. NPDC005227]|uniref:hypothetical protein n=1 Tax=Streptomyces sp. NPDC005227 TaxID=3364707 RepID=UPI0036858861